MGLALTSRRLRLPSQRLLKNNRLQTVLRDTFDFVTIHVCESDGQGIGEFEEEDFRDNLFANRFPPDSYYWQEEWRTGRQPVASYRALAKTQRISFAPPMARTVRIDICNFTPLSSSGEIWSF